MVNGNYVLYGDKPASESEIVDDHVHSRADRKVKRKTHRTANELQYTLNQAQLDNETDAVKYEKTIKEPRLLRYVPNTDVKENFVSEKFETYDLKATEERPRRYTFVKKPKNPADGSVNYAYSVYSRSSSGCSSPNANLPTISEHSEQYSTHKVRTMSNPAVNDLLSGYDTKLDKYFSKPREIKPFAAKGSHPDSLYRVTGDGSTGVNKITRALRVMRWPIVLFAICIALAVFVYFLMPDNLDTSSTNGTHWDPVIAEVGHQRQYGHRNKASQNKDVTKKNGTKTSEIDFYNAENDKNINLTSILDTIAEMNAKRLPIYPVFPTHLTPEVQYGNEKADSDKRIPKILVDSILDNSTLKPHITQKPEKPLAIYFKKSDSTTAPAETITIAETINFQDQKQTNNKVEESSRKVYPSHAPKEYVVSAPKGYILEKGDDHGIDNLKGELANFRSSDEAHVSFTSSHSKLFGISLEDAEKMKSTTQSALYYTRVSPTLPSWRDRDDTTTKKYPTNTYSEVQCHSTRMALCRGVLPYDLAGAPVKVSGVDITSLVTQIDYLVAVNCSDRVRHFFCALLEPECSPPPYTPKKPCYNLCKAIVDTCDGHIPRELSQVFNCKQYSRSNNDCVTAKSPCYSREFTCSDGSCIPRDWTCNGRHDCASGDDELRCVACKSTDFKCPSGGCVLNRWLCDGYADCSKGEDESELICGPRHVQAPNDRNSELGEESAGSALAPVVRRPNKVLIAHRKQHSSRGENDSSKELLVTSDTNNAVSSMARTFTPSPSRLTPYHRSTRPVPDISNIRKKINSKSDTTSLTRNTPSSESTEVNIVTKPSRKNVQERESSEDVNIADLGFFEDIDKDKMSTTSKETKNPTQVFTEASTVQFMRTSTEAEPNVIVFKGSNNIEKYIDGAALLKKANAIEAANTAAAEAQDTIDMNNTTNDSEKEGWARAHTSPCPSGELRCVDGLCITLAQLCDGTIDCSDHADEDNCYT